MRHDPILKTKLFIPPFPEGNLSRSRLLNLVSWGVQRKVTMVTAPAGFGKTSLVLDWISKADQAVAWFSIDAYDDDFSSFFSYFIAALKTIIPGVNDLIIQLPNSPQKLENNKLLIPMINDIADSGEEIILVLDDFHEINSPAVLQSLCYLIEHCPENLHLVFISRSVPIIPCARLAVQGELGQITEDDLRFTQEECQKFTREHLGTKFSDENAWALCKKTEGWAALLKMAVTFLTGKEDITDQIISFSGVTTSVADYLLDEIFSDMSNETFQFAVETSMFDRFSASLCDYVFQRDDSAEQIVKLKKLHLFLKPLDENREWYRNHNMVSEYLEKRLVEISVRLLKQKHIRATEWFQQHGYMTEAVNHARMAGDIPLLIKTIKSVANPQWASGRVHIVAGWLDLLPANELKKDSELCFLFAWTNYLMGRRAEVNLGLEWAEENLKGMEKDNIPQEYMGMMAAVKAAVYNRNNQYSEAIESAKLAKSLLPQDNQYWQIATAVTLGITYQSYGYLEDAKLVLKEILQETQKVVFPLATMTSYSILAEIAIFQGHLSEAFTTAQEGIEYSSQKAGPRVSVMGELYFRMAYGYYFQNKMDLVREMFANIEKISQGELVYFRQLSYFVLQIRVAIEEGDLSRADQLITEFDSLADSFGSSIYENKPYALRALLALKLGHIDKATALIDKFPISLESLPLARVPIELDAMLNKFIAADKFEDANRLIDSFLPKAIENGFKPFAIMLLLNQAEVFYQQNDHEKMILQIRQAINFAEKEGIIRCFVTKGEKLLRMLKIFQQESNGATDFVRKLIRHIENDLGTTDRSEHLSKRETEVLALIAEGHTNKEIGEILVISVETVNNHARKIYRKLGVNSRVLAVAKAKELTLLD